MSEAQSSDQLKLFDENIRDRIVGLLGNSRCLWCRNPNRRIRSKGLCSSCYEWDRELRGLERPVSELPRKALRDPHFDVRHEIEVARCAIELCKLDGGVLDHQLEFTAPIDLEEAFHNLGVRTLGRAGAHLFYGSSFWFYDFSESQRAWLWYTVSIITNEMNSRNRRARARVLSTVLKHKGTEALRQVLGHAEGAYSTND